MNNIHKIITGTVIGCMLFSGVVFAEGTPDTEVAETSETVSALSNDDINIRDPYILVHDGKYYMYGTRAKDCFTSPMDGFDCYVSTDLETWEGPYEIYHKTDDNPADWAYYAPECYEIDGKFYFFCSWKQGRDGTEYENILTSDDPLGPFTLYAENITTGIDATLYQENGKYYMINNHNTPSEADDNSFVPGVYAFELADDFKGLANPKGSLLFTTEGAGWISKTGFGGNPNTMTDGPCPYKMSDGTLLILWSCMDASGVYNVGVARSDDGTLSGKWTHDPKAIFPGNQGHNMIFKSLGNKLMTAMHYPNDLGKEHPYFLTLSEDAKNHTLKVADCPSETETESEAA